MFFPELYCSDSSNGFCRILCFNEVFGSQRARFSILAPQPLQPGQKQNVLIHVDTLNQRRDAKGKGWSRSFVKVAPPTVHAGVGNALRQAFALDVEVRTAVQFEDLLARLDEEHKI